MTPDIMIEEIGPGMDQLWSDWSEWYLERFYLCVAMSANMAREISDIEMLAKTLGETASGITRNEI